jgi:hypothetical protein
MRAILVVIAASLVTGCESTEVRGRDYAIDNDPPVLALIRTADEVYVFPVLTPLKPHRDDVHLRLLASEARQKIARLLGERQNWWHGGWGHLLVDDGSTDVGLLFRHQKNELVLFFCGGVVKGTFNGEETFGLFHEKRAKTLEEWKRRYAHPELSAKSGLTRR